MLYSINWLWLTLSQPFKIHVFPEPSWSLTLKKGCFLWAWGHTGATRPGPCDLLLIRGSSTPWGQGLSGPSESMELSSQVGGHGRDPLGWWVGCHKDYFFYNVLALFSVEHLVLRWLAGRGWAIWPFGLMSALFCDIKMIKCKTNSYAW